MFRIRFLPLAFLTGLASIWAGCSCTEDADHSGFGGAGAGTGGFGGAATFVGPGGSGPAACLEGLKSIALSPADKTVVLDGGTPDSIPFKATGTFKDGASKDLDVGALDWTASRDDDTPPGTIHDGVLVPFRSAGGVVKIGASDGCGVGGTTTVTFKLDKVIGSPGDPDDWEGPVETDGAVPAIVYPSDQTRFPRNLYRTLFQWRSEDFTEFRLTFEGPFSTVTVFTDGAHGLCASANPAAGCWEVNELAWNSIAGSNAGHTATWTVDALDTSTIPATIRRSASIEIGFSKMDVEGAIFYWSTTSAGVRRGRISQQDPEDYIVGKPIPTTYPVDDAVGCVACHTVSRNGKYMVAPVQAKSGGSLWVLEVTQNAPPNPLVKSVEDTKGHGFATISPNDKYVVAAWGGRMWRVNRDDGSYVDELPTGELEGTQPDWSPLGHEVLFATGNGDSPSGSSLAKIPFANGAWGVAKELLAADGKSNLFPMFSFDGKWIAFSRGKGGHGDNTAQLMVLPADGGQPIECINANRVTSNEMTSGQYQNSQPTWAPPGDLNWVAFNTKREYGVVHDGGTQQIWVAAIDVEKAKDGKDPSYPAFRVPFQGLDENNHRAFWARDVGDGSGSGGAGGGGVAPCTDILSVGELCDPLNDCCETGAYCDSDDGTTFACVTVPPS